MTRQPPAPGALKRAFDDDLVAAAVNLAGEVEGVLMRTSEQARRNPVAALFVALACGYLARSVWRRL